MSFGSCKNVINKLCVNKSLLIFIKIILHLCCGLQIRPVEKQLNQLVIRKRYCISRKRNHTKEVLAVLCLQSVSQMSCKEREVDSIERAKLGEYV